MAVESKSTATSAAGRRWFFGTNVTVMVLLAACVLAAINWIGHLRNVRADLAGGLASHRVSERTKRILAEAPEGLRITTVYTSDEPESDRKKYLPRLRDYCDEIKQAKRSVTVEHLYSGTDRAQLRERVQGKFGKATEEHEKAIGLAKAVWGELSETLGPQQKAITQLLQSESWLGGFSPLANIATVVEKDLKNLQETGQEVENLIHGEGLPRYQEANSKIKTANAELKRHIEETRNWTKDMDKLVKVLADPESEFAKTSKAKLQEMTARVENLKKIAGDPNDANVPEDTTAILQDFAKAAASLAEWLMEEYGRVGAFVKEHPAISNLPDWRIQRQIFVMDLPSVLAESADSLSGNGQQLRGILRSKDTLPKDELQGIVRKCRNAAAQYEKNLKVWSDRLTKVLGDGAKIDEASKTFLASGAGGEAFGKVLERLGEVEKKIAALPEIKLDEVAERLQQDNIVVVEGPQDVRVVTFDEVWPYADPMGARMSMGAEDQEHRRVFDGDTAISNAMLAMGNSKPFATVIIVGYESQPPPQMRQIQRPNVGIIPMETLSTLKERLKGANFVVKDWNLGATGEEAEKPKPQEGTQAVYVILPPAEAQQENPFMRQPPTKPFGEKQMEQVKKAIAENGRAIFLTVADPPMPSMFAPPPSYAYQDLLKKDWGIDVEFENRVIRGVADRQDPEQFGIDIVQWMYMPLTSFTKHPIGEPLRARRILMREVCPVVKADSVPEGVKLETVLEVPAGVHDVWAEKDIMRIARALREGRQNSTFTVGPDAVRPPFSVILAGEKEGGKSKVVVTGNGLCYADNYLGQRVMRFEGQRSRLITDPPPTENLDLFLNMLYWLSDRSDLIASGPAPVPVVGAIEPASRRSLWLVAVGWAFAVLVVGGAVMMVRRK